MSAVKSLGVALLCVFAYPLAEAAAQELPAGALLRLGTPQFRHDEEILSIAYSPDGKLLASAGMSGEVRVWNVADGKLLVKLPAGSGETVLFTPDSRGLICDGTTGGLALREAATGRVIRSFGKQARPSRRFNNDFSNNCIALSPDGTILAETGEDEIILWRVVDGKRLPGLRDVPQSVCSLAFSPDGKTLAGGTHMGDGNPVYIWDVASRRLERQTEKALRWVHAIAFSRDGKTFAAADNDNRTIICDVATAKRVALIKSPARSIAYSADGAFLVIGSTYSGMEHGYIHLANAASKEVVRVLRGHVPSVNCVAFAPTGKTFASAGPEGSIRFWDARSGRENVIPRGHVSPVSGVVFSADGKRVATLSSVDHTLLIWDAVTGAMISRIAIHCGHDEHCTDRHGRRLCFSPDGNRIACDSSVYDIKTGRAVVTGKGENIIAVSPDGRWQATTPRDPGFFNDCVDVSAAATGTKIVRLVMPDKRVVRGASAFSPDGRLLAVVSFYGSCKGQDPPQNSVHLFAMPSGKLLHDFMPSNLGPSALAFTPDGKLLVTTSWRRVEGIQLWRVADGRPWCRVPGSHDEQSGRDPCPATVSADNRYLAFNDEDHSVVIWEVATRQQVHRLRGSRRALAALAFSPRGTKLISAGVDMRPIVWDLAPGRKASSPPRTTLKSEQLADLWKDLAGGDAPRAYRALWALAAAPQVSVQYLGARLTPVEHIAEDRIRALIRDLDSSEFATRERATAELRGIGPRAEKQVRAALAGDPPEEARRRLTFVLSAVEAAMPGSTADTRRAIRAIQVLELIGTPEARAVLKRLAKGAPDAYETRDARAALERLERQVDDEP